MNKKIVERIYKLVKEYNNKNERDPKIQSALPSKPLVDFHQWADSKEFKGGFLVENENGENVWLLLIKWHERKDFYIVLFPENKSGPVAEIHEVLNSDDELVLKWMYRPSKRDGNNEKRKKYFEKYFLSLEVLISVPNKLEEVGDFLNELLALSENREKADNLSIDTPSTRDGFPEGKKKEKLHKQRERNSSLIRTVKKEAFNKFGKLECQCCSFDFVKKYGNLGEEFIEAHHTKPVSELHPDGEKTKKEDIALVCSNCHRMLHRKRPWLTMQQLKMLIE